jgi:hypothetical protein
MQDGDGARNLVIVFQAPGSGPEPGEAPTSGRIDAERVRSMDAVSSPVCTPSGFRG